jgi:hypothetical protein
LLKISNNIFIVSYAIAKKVASLSLVNNFELIGKLKDTGRCPAGAVTIQPVRNTEPVFTGSLLLSFINLTAMAKKFQLNIPKPCHEDWDKMTPQEKGRFCGSCQKQVIDFTTMGDSQLVAFFRKKPTSSVCGRFMNDQLDRTFTIPQKRIPWLKYFFQVTIPLYFGINKLNAQIGKVSVMGKIKPSIEQQMVKIEPSFVKGDSAILVEVIGVIENQFGKPIPFASVVLKDANEGTMADKDGIFTVILPPGLNTATYTVSSVNYESKDVEIKKNVGTKLLTVQLAALPDLPVVEVKSSILENELVHFFMGAISVVRGEVEKIETIPEPISHAFSPIVYPNPVAPGAFLNINCKKMEEGYYSIQLIGMAGQIVSTEKVWLDKDAGVLNMPVKHVASGNYILRMINKKTGKQVSERLIVK